MALVLDCADCEWTERIDDEQLATETLLQHVRGWDHEVHVRLPDAPAPDRPVAIAAGQDASKYHEVINGEPACSQLAHAHNWEIVEAAEAEAQWYEPCFRESCRDERDR